MTPDRTGAAARAAAAPAQEAPELTQAQQSRMVQALAAALRAGDLGQAAEPPECLQTHISWVLLHGGWAYKFKKALRTSFLDQSTLQRRRLACAEELRLNRRLAPDLYVDVVEIRGSPEQPTIGGAGPVLDVAVKMHAFAAQGLWDRRAAAGELGASDVDTLAALMAAFHDRVAVASPQGSYGKPEQVRRPIGDNLRELQARWPDAAGRHALARLAQWEAQAYTRLAPVLQQRVATGRVRECHGDLHLGNVAQVQGRCTVFDGIDFDPALRWLDVIDEIAFMAMDLQAHRLPALAHRFIDAYLQHNGDYEGVQVLDYYQVHRALVRAKVGLLQAQGDSVSPATKGYLALAQQLTQPRRPALLITHGLSGSGKSFGTQRLLQACGAVRIRADVERKRLASSTGTGSAGELPSADVLYGPRMTEATYARLLGAAEPVLAGGHHTILDATFLLHAQRARARLQAAAWGVPFFILGFSAEPALLRERLRRRALQGGDASDADEAVLEWQLRVAEPLRDEERDAWVPAAPDTDWATLLQRLGS